MGNTKTSREYGVDKDLWSFTGKYVRFCSK